MHDGVRGDVETKGDGVKRAVLFALFRTLLHLRNAERSSENGDGETRERYQFLFEEPELYLHPNAQRILYDALVQISADHQVCVCTHSPYFFSPEDQGTFLRLRKIENPDDPHSPPVAEILPIHLSGAVSVKDAYQIICYENNSAAFFCDRVVLVEGDCDVIYLQHLAKKLNGDWDFLRRNVAIVRIGGKGGFFRYRRFFEEFGVEIRIVADLDVLIDQFGKLGADEESRHFHNQLIQEIDAIIDRDGLCESVATDTHKDAITKRSFRDRYELLREACRRVAAGDEVSPTELPDIEDLFAHERNVTRRCVLATSEEIAPTKHTLLEQLRRQGINVLSIGAVDEYYPDDCTGPDKPTRALNACEKVAHREHAVACSPLIARPTGGQVAELDVIFANLFEGLPQPVELPATTVTFEATY